MSLFILDSIGQFGMNTHYFDIQVGNLDGFVNFDCVERSHCRSTYR